MTTSPYIPPSAPLVAQDPAATRDPKSLGRKVFGYAIGGAFIVLSLAFFLVPHTGPMAPDPFLVRLGRVAMLFGPPVGLSVLTGHLMGAALSRGILRTLASGMLLGIAMGFLVDGVLYALVFFTDENPMPTRDFIEGLGWFGGIFALVNVILGAVLLFLAKKKGIVQSDAAG